MFRMRRPSSQQVERFLDDLLQARFRRDSALAVRRAIEGR
jgi:hypothetical protein